MINVFYGRESIDKSRYMFEHITGKTTILVPDQSTLEIEKDAFEFMGTDSLLDVEILGFSRFSDRILDECGKDKRIPIDKYGRHMMLDGILRKNRDSLMIYKDPKRAKGFIELLNNFLAQIRQNNISSEMLTLICDNLKEDSLLKHKLTDLCIIYRLYEEELADKYIDTEMYTDTVIEKIPESEYIKERTIWVYGFDTFTARNMGILSKLAEVCPALNVIVTYDEKSRDANLFEVTENMIYELEKISEAIGCSFRKEKISGYERQRKAALEHLEKELYSIPYRQSDDCDGIRIVSCQDKYSEAESAASYIISLVRDKGLRFKDIALVCNSMEKDMLVISRVFSMYNIPLFIDTKQDIRGNRIVTLITGLLSVISEGYENSYIFTMLKTGLLGFETEEIEELENYVLRYRIKGGMWKKEFARGKNGYTEEEFQRIENTRRNLTELIDEFSDKFREEKAMGTRIKVIYEFLSEKIDIPAKVNEEVERLTAEGNIERAAHTSQIWNLVTSLFEQIYELQGETECGDGELLKLLEAGIEEMETGIIPQNIDGISVGTCQRSRFGRIKALVVMSADEGVLPMNISGDELLNNDELSILKEQNVSLMKLDKIKVLEESLGLYRTFAAPSEYLWIGTSLVDTSGEGIKPSPVINTIRRIFPDLSVEHDIFSDRTGIELVAGPVSTMEHMTTVFREGIDGKEIPKAMCDAAGWINSNSEIPLENIRQGLMYKGMDFKIDRQKAVKLYSRGRDELKLSPSGLEKYGRCPFSYFISYGLSPQENRVFEMAGREIGDVYHHILMRLSYELTDDDIPVTDDNSGWMSITEEEYDKLMDKIIEEEREDYREGLLGFSNEEKYRTDRLAKIIKKTGWAMISQVRKGKIKEAAFEVEFGRGKKIPPIEIEAGGRKVRIEGIIDRIDVLPDDSVKIIDYKTGKEKFSVAEAEKGWKLQLMIYLDAGLKYGDINRKPAGVFYFNISEPEVDESEKAKKEDTIPLKDFKLDGTVINSPETINSIAGEFAGYSEVVQLRNTKSGIIGTSEDRLFEPHEFDEFMEKVNGKIKELCEDIVAGKINAAPKKKDKDMTACTYCQYKGICRFDLAFEDCSYEYV